MEIFKKQKKLRNTHRLIEIAKRMQWENENKKKKLIENEIMLENDEQTKYKLCNDSPKQKNRMDTYISDRSSTICFSISKVKPFCVFHCPVNTICCILIRARSVNEFHVCDAITAYFKPFKMLVIPRYSDAKEMTATFFVFFTNMYYDLKHKNQKW